MKMRIRAIAMIAGLGIMIGLTPTASAQGQNDCPGLQNAFFEAIGCLDLVEGSPGYQGQMNACQNISDRHLEQCGSSLFPTCPCYSLDDLEVAFDMTDPGLASFSGAVVSDTLFEPSFASPNTVAGALDAGSASLFCFFPTNADFLVVDDSELAACRDVIDDYVAAHSVPVCTSPAACNSL